MKKCFERTLKMREDLHQTEIVALGNAFRNEMNAKIEALRDLLKPVSLPAVNLAAVIENDTIRNDIIPHVSNLAEKPMTDQTDTIQHVSSLVEMSMTDQTDIIRRISTLAESSVTETQVPTAGSSWTRRPKISASLRANVWVYYIGSHVGVTKCQCCHLQDITRDNYKCGHIVAVSKEGKTNLQNLRPICGLCNRSMGSKNLFDFSQECGYTALENVEDHVMCEKGADGGITDQDVHDLFDFVSKYA